MVGFRAVVFIVGTMLLSAGSAASAAWSPSPEDRRAVEFWNGLSDDARRTTCAGHFAYPIPPTERTPYWHLLQNRCPSIADAPLELATFGGADAGERLAAKNAGAYYCGVDTTKESAAFNG